MPSIGYTGEKHPETFTRPPKGPRKPGQLSEEQLDEYFNKGFTIVQDFFSKEELNNVIDDVIKLVDDLAARLLEGGKIKNSYSELGFYERLTAIEKEFPGANILLHKTEKLTKAMHAIAGHEKMLNLLEDILGPNIAFNPVWNLRTKTPKNDATVVPWHQDCAYFDNDSYSVHIPTAWIPLLDATAHNGTMEMVPHGHSEGAVVEHTCCAGPTWYVMVEEDALEKELKIKMSDAEVLDIPMGSFVLFNNFTPHRSLPNVSQQIRWALDFRWQKADTPSCLYGLKEKCVVRLESQPDLVADFDAFDSVDRNKKQFEYSGVVPDPFSTVISGPWMKKWKLTNHNRHTEAFNDDESTWNPAMVHG